MIKEPLINAVFPRWLALLARCLLPALACSRACSARALFLRLCASLTDDTGRAAGQVQKKITKFHLFKTVFIQF